MHVISGKLARSRERCGWLANIAPALVYANA